MNIKRFQMKSNRTGFLKAIRAFALSVGAAAVCTFSAVSLPSQAQEAAAFRVSNAAAAGTAIEEPKEVIPLGSAFGIKLFTDGVIVASLSDIYTENGICCPAADCGIKPGDYIMAADGRPIASNRELARLIGASEGRDMTLTVRRGENTFEATLHPVYGEGSFKSGMWIRDSAAGIGTLTFYDPASGAFAGLGHGICDMDVGGVMSLKHGEPAPITLCGIQRGEENEPGQLKGYFSSDDALGDLLINNDTGVYGTLTEKPQGQPIAVMPREQVKAGPVELLATLDETGPQRYEARIERISAKEQHTKNLVIKVTDPRLLERTGGIVQGMSGCPILQDGKLAGAVTHVFTDDPSMGYGIFAETMAEQISQLR